MKLKWDTAHLTGCGWWLYILTQPMQGSSFHEIQAKLKKCPLDYDGNKNCGHRKTR